MNCPNSKLIAILPRVRIHKEGAPQLKSFELGPVKIWLDNDQLWLDEFGRARPSWMKIFRWFPESVLEKDWTAEPNSEDPEFAEPMPAYGTVITSDNPDWLRKYIDNLLSVIYFLSDPTGGFRSPAEAFEYFLLNPDAAPNEHVGLLTKTGECIETRASLYLTPPLALRTTICRCNVNFDEKQNTELLTRFAAVPNDRIVTACRHLFRASFGGMFQSPWEQDVASYCACLEAAFDIPEGKITERLIAAVQELLGTGKDIENFMAGAYAIRSVFNHGAQEIEGDDRTEKLRAFRDHPAVNIQTLRHICCEAIREQLLDSAVQRANSIEREMVRRYSYDRKRVTQRFASNSLWKEMAKVFADKKASERIASFGTDEQDKLLSLCCRFLTAHTWEFTLETPEPKKFVQVLTTMACVFGQQAKQLGDTEFDQRGCTLYAALKSKNSNAVLAWFHESKRNTESVSSDPLYKTVYTVAAHVTELVECREFCSRLQAWFDKDVIAAGDTGP